MGIVLIFKRRLVLWMDVSRFIRLEWTLLRPRPENFSADYPIHVLYSTSQLTLESKRAQESEDGEEEGGDSEEQREKKARKRVSPLLCRFDFRRNERKQH